MRSTTGQYYVALDHVRALAAFTVFSWHFIHVNNFHVKATAFPPFSILSEGHTGVAIFMTLSGYLFARLLAGRDIHYARFMWNRVLRLLPLLVLVIAIAGLRDALDGGNSRLFLWNVVCGFWKPTLPNGGWSITVEFHFYLLLPLLLFMAGRSRLALPAVILGAIALRLGLFLQDGEVQRLAYLTLVGRVDQFVFGILAYQYRHLFLRRHILVGFIAAAFALFYTWFESQGGFIIGGYPSSSPLWIVMTTIEGLAYGALIAWYDNSFRHGAGPLSRFVAVIGSCSYSIYLLHFFFYERMGSFIDSHILAIDNLYIALAMSLLAFLCMVPLAWLSYRFVELPFLRHRKTYLRG